MQLGTPWQRDPSAARMQLAAERCVLHPWQDLRVQAPRHTGNDVQNRRLLNKFAGLSFALMATLPLMRQASAQPDLSQKTGSTVADTASSTYRFEKFDIASADGERQYRVQMAIPRSAVPHGGFPAIYLLDGNAAFAALTPEQLNAEALRASPLVIVAIGYATDLRFDVAARTFDYTPRAQARAPDEDPDAARGRATGGADAFLALLEQRIRPQVHARAAIDPLRQTLWGHSYGGLFVLHAFLSRPEAFGTYVAADPSMWWRDGFILQEEGHAAPLPESRRVRLLVMAGDAGRGGAAAPAPRPGVDAAQVGRMQSARSRVAPGAARDFSVRQGKRHGVDAAYWEFAGVNHGAMLAASLPAALDLAGQ